MKREFLMKDTILLLLFLFLSISQPLLAQGDLLIFPKRIAFEGLKNRTQNINLTNIGKDTATYKLSYNQIKMDQDGKFISIDEPEPEQRFASPFLRFYPRIITLAPNESQIVKIQLIKTNELQQGEYRSHLYFRAVPKNKVLEKEDSTNKAIGLSINLIPVYGLSIANIITIGEATSTVQLSNLLLSKSEDGICAISLDFNRSGNKSCYGDILVSHISPEGITTIAATIKGFAVYTPGNLRKTKIKLSPITNIDYTRGQLRVLYTAQDVSIKYAEATLLL